uniref:Rac1 GTP binding protein n=1 Tax=Hirondellea gigas TaxID=1518452 RepID=A0A6A7GC96_9CRUS
MQFVKCVVVGDGAVGKTCLLISATQDKFPYDYIPTVFDNYDKIVSVDDKRVKISLLDTAGQDDFDKFRPISYNDADVFLVCFAVISTDSFKNADRKWFPEIKLKGPSGARYILVGTKTDLRKDAEATTVSSEEGKTLADKHDSPYIECSALTQDGLPRVFETIAREAFKGPRQSEKSSCCVIF